MVYGIEIYVQQHMHPAALTSCLYFHCPIIPTLLISGGPAEETGSRQDPEVPATSDRKGEESAPPTTEVLATSDRKGEESAPPTTKDMDNDKHEDTQDQASSRTEVQVESTGDTEKEPHPPAPPDHTPSNSPSPDNRGFVDTDEASNILGGEMQPGSTQGASPRGSVVVGIPSQRCVLADGFIFAMHRRIVSGLIHHLMLLVRS